MSFNSLTLESIAYHKRAYFFQMEHSSLDDTNLLGFIKLLIKDFGADIQNI